MRRPRLLLGTIAAESFMMTFDGAAVQMTLPTLTRHFGAGLYAVQWTMTAFLLVSTAALLPAGRAGDAWGRDRVWRAGVGLFALSSALCLLAPTLAILIAARAVQGLASALATANSAPLLVEAFPHKSGRALAVGNIAIALGLVSGPALGSLLTELVSWRAIFAVALPVGAAVWLISPRVLPRSPRRPRSLDLAGGALSVAALTGLILGGTWAWRRGWTSPPTRIALAAGVVALFAFLLQQRRSPDPLLHRTLLRRRTFASALAALLLGSTGLFTLTVAMPFLLVVVQGRPISHSGLLVGALSLGLCAAAPLAGRAFDRFGSRALSAGGLLLITAAIIILLATLPTAGARTVALALALAGIGLGTFEPPNTAGALQSIPPRDLGVGMATLTAIRNLGMTLGVALSATLIDRSLTERAGPIHGLHLALGLGAVAALLGTVAAALRPR